MARRRRSFRYYAAWQVYRSQHSFDKAESRCTRNEWQARASEKEAQEEESVGSCVNPLIEQLLLFV